MGLHRLACVAISAACVSGMRPAQAYEYTLHTHTRAQSFGLSLEGPSGTGGWLQRRRFLQTVTLDVWNVGQTSPRPWRRGAPRQSPTPWSFRSHLRVDHDFGSWIAQPLAIGVRPVDPVRAIPELERDRFGLEFLYALVSARGLWQQRLDLDLGRQIVWAEGLHFDGASVRVRIRPGISAFVRAGARVRDASPLAHGTLDLDGTQDAGCTEYIESDTSVGRWESIWRTEDRLDSRRICPMRTQWMPTASVGIEGVRRAIFGRLFYRRSQSRTVGRLAPASAYGEVDRGLYPNEQGQAPSLGTTEEIVEAHVATTLHFASVRARPQVRARYSLLHGAVQSLQVVSELSRLAHRLELGLGYEAPFFDGDSIFNVFGAEPTTRLALRYLAGDRRLRARAALWRRFFGRGMTSRRADGASLSVRHRRGGWRFSGVLSGERGPGGANLRVATELDSQLSQRVRGWTRASAYSLGSSASDRSSRSGFATEGALRLNPSPSVGVGVHLQDVRHSDRPHDLRVLALLDLAVTESL